MDNFYGKPVGSHAICLTYNRHNVYFLSRFVHFWNIFIQFEICFGYVKKSDTSIPLDPFTKTYFLYLLIGNFMGITLNSGFCIDF